MAGCYPIVVRCWSPLCPRHKTDNGQFYIFNPSRYRAADTDTTLQKHQTPDTGLYLRRQLWALNKAEVARTLGLCSSARTDADDS